MAQTTRMVLVFLAVLGLGALVDPAFGAYYTMQSTWQLSCSSTEYFDTALKVCTPCSPTGDTTNANKVPDPKLVSVNNTIVGCRCAPGYRRVDA